jgi:Raf kinase inhibitor-like YbhB/YbcL family protein
MMLFSPAFPPGGAIPAEHTCDGADIWPRLARSKLPPGAKSLALAVEDPEAPTGSFLHWAAFDIPVGRDGLPAGYGRAHPASRVYEARNDFERMGYGGPCPPPRGGTHHYHFQFLALGRAQLGPPPAASALSVLEAAQADIMDRTGLVGTHSR